jgi:hypothetical protein
MVLLFIAFVYTITLFDNKEGFRLFDIDPHNNSGYIPYVPQDVICMILDSAGVKIDRLSVLQSKCQYSSTPAKKPDDSNICRI